MNFSPRFMYADDAGNTGGGAAPATKVNTEVDLTKPLFSETELKSFGFDNADQLKEHLRQHKENAMPETEKKQKQDLEKANLIKFSTEQKLMNVDEFNEYETLSKKADKDLVYDRYAAEQKEDNPAITDDEIKENFDTEFPLASTNEKAKTRAEQKLSKQAKEIRSPFTEKFTKAEESFKTHSKVVQTYPQFDKFVSDVIKENTPDKLTVFTTKEGEDEIPVDIEITADQRKEIEKIFKSPRNLRDYMDGGDKQDDLKAKISKKIKGYIRENNFDNITKKVYETGVGIGVKKGSTAGAENLYGLLDKKDAKSNDATQDVMTQIRESHKKVAAELR